ncbi:hypothetical protein Aau02nite_25860 [Amorphoplanes auranticolor]|uniref:DUF2269 domain-containing protein n=2 Tax=Actinoplanes auranticolor TaxID=47988 RepID=A0A919SAY9_9ACTN|nr:hypothetical protein Aau02nite_25860 [Actinoplanes auranticolor]
MLVAHVACSVGWLGAVVTSLALSVMGLTADEELVRAVHLTLEPLGWYVLVPLSVASLLTGLVQSLGTTWGLFRHYWVLIKLLMTLFATGVLLLYMGSLAALADRAGAAAPGSNGTAGLADPSPVLHSAAAVVLLLIATVLSIYKPRGLTGHGRRIRHRESQVTPSGRA